jgi:hypothetical protein
MDTVFRLARVALTMALFSGLVVVGAMATDPAYPQAGPKGDLITTGPPTAGAPTTCALLMARVREMHAFRIMGGGKARKYVSTAFKAHPPIDTVAFIESGDQTGILMAKDGCVVASHKIPTKAHEKIMVAAFGLAV